MKFLSGGVVNSRPTFRTIICPIRHDFEKRWLTFSPSQTNSKQEKNHKDSWNPDWALCATADGKFHTGCVTRDAPAQVTKCCVVTVNLCVCVCVCVCVFVCVYMCVCGGSATSPSSPESDFSPDFLACCLAIISELKMAHHLVSLNPGQVRAPPWFAMASRVAWSRPAE